MYVDILRAKDLNDGEWRNLQAISKAALTDVLQRSEEEIDHLVRWDDPGAYVESRRDPNTMVGQTLNPNQTFSNPRVAVAIDGNDTVGFCYAANNVSGDTYMKRALKLMGDKKKYLWFRDIAVEPSYQRSGVARMLAANILMSSRTFQPVSAYIWPDEMRFMPQTLRKSGFVPTGEQQVDVFGADAEPVRQVRMQAPSVAAVVSRLY